MDMIAILQKLESLDMIRLHKVIGNYYQCYCPIHNNGNERRPSFGILLEEEVRNGQVYPQGFSHCFTCGYAKPFVQLVSDILKRKSISLSALDWLKENVPGFVESPDLEADRLVPPTLMKQLNNAYALDYIRRATKKAEPQFVSEEELASYRYTVPYMYERGLTDDIIAKYDIGVDMNFLPRGAKKVVPSITFPVKDIKGRTLFVCRRAIENKRFYLPEAVEKPLYGVYELPPQSKIVIIVESCFNALTAVKYGVPSVALLGTGTPYQMNLLKQLGVKEFVIGTDPDEAGDRSARRIQNALRSVAIIRRMKDIPEGKDINDLTYDEFYEIFNNRE